MGRNCKVASVRDMLVDDFKLSESATESKFVLDIVASLPSNNFIRSSSEYKRKFYCVMDSASPQKDIYILAPALVRDFEDECYLATASYVIDQYGVPRIFLAKHPSSGNELWGQSRHEGLLLSETKWVRLRPNMAGNRYDIIVASGEKPCPVFPETDFDEILEECFKDRIIDSMDHELVQRLQGAIL